MMLKKIMILAFAAALFVSCDDDDTIAPGTSAEAATFMPMTVGSHWIYYNTYEDEDGEEVTRAGSSPYWDTVRVAEIANYEGRAAYRLSTTASNGDDVFDQWYSYDGKHVLIFPNSDGGMADLGGLPLPDFELGNQWVRMFSMENQKVEVGAVEIPETSLGPVVISGDVEMDLKTEENSNYSYNGKSHASRLAIGTGEIDGRLSTPGFPTVFPLTGVITDQSVFISGIGLAEARSYQEFEEIPGLGDLGALFGGGDNFVSVRTLISHEIK